MKYMSRPKSGAVKEIDIYIDIADILGQEYRYRIVSISVKAILTHL